MRDVAATYSVERPWLRFFALWGSVTLLVAAPLATLAALEFKRYRLEALLAEMEAVEMIVGQEYGIVPWLPDRYQRQIAHVSFVCEDAESSRQKCELTRRARWVRELYLTGNEGTLRRADLHRLLHDIEGLEILEVEGWKVDGRETALVAQHLTLISVTLQGTGIDDAAFAQLASLPSLKRICLSDASITGAGLTPLRQHAQLTDLKLNNCQSLGDEAATTVASLRNLSTLDLADCGIGDGVVQAAASLHLLSNLNLTGTKATAACLPCFHGAPCRISLNHLDLSRTAIGLHDLHSLPEFPELSVLYLEGLKADAACMRPLSRGFLANTSIGLRRAEIDDATLLALLGDGSLNGGTLDLSDTQVSLSDPRLALRLAKVLELRLDGCPVDDEGAQRIGDAAIPKMELSLTRTEVTGACLKRLRGMKKFAETYVY